MTILVVLYVIALAIVHICFALGVYEVTSRLRRDGKEPLFVGVEVWTLATLLGGVSVAGVYWLMHQSRFSKYED